MPRPRKCRRVCCLPQCNHFGPLNSNENPSQCIQLTVDEYETIRLIDLEGLMQEACAKRMNVARTTIQSIYNEARKKIAEALVLGKILYIEGGEYKICEGAMPECGKKICQKDRCTHGVAEEKNFLMK